ncbi:MAG: potassium efflux system protein, partial [Polyangiales bacterium]
ESDGESSGATRRSWFALTVALAIPLFLAVMVVAGYTYSAGLLLEKLLDTLWLAFGIILLRELVVRWILVSRRRALFRRGQESESATQEPTPAQGSKINRKGPTTSTSAAEILASDAATQQLANTTLVVGGLLGLGSIWSSVLAAFTVFSNVVLWETHRAVDGEQVVGAVTLYDMFVAIMVAIVTVAAIRHVPSVVEISLRQRESLTAGSRLAFATLARYAISVVGVSLAVSFLGVDWGKIQWLVAALGVGIGFGLQEIVANVISGLFILIERPIRVGDIITVGDASGTVRQIAIRATTIRTRDEQELLVPNREIITGRVLNWTLSDSMIRIYFNVGVAYGSDVEEALKLLAQSAADHPNVLEDPAPIVTFESFGDNTLVLGLRCYVPAVEVRLGVTTDLHRAINTAYAAANIVIAFPQRDIHLDTLSPLELRVVHEAAPVQTKPETE